MGNRVGYCARRGAAGEGERGAARHHVAEQLQRQVSERAGFGGHAPDVGRRGARPRGAPSNTPPPPSPPEANVPYPPPSVSTQESSCRAAECALHRCKVEKYSLNTRT